jgi:hypothetical protein
MEEILSVPAEYDVSFEIMKISDIMTDFEIYGRNTAFRKNTDVHS